MGKKISQVDFETLKSLDKSLYDSKGREIVNPVPNKFVANMKRPETLEEKIAKVLKHQDWMKAQQEGIESWQDANDFEVPDDFEEVVLSEYQLTQMQEEQPIEEVLPDVQPTPTEPPADPVEPDPVTEPVTTTTDPATGQ